MLIMGIHIPKPASGEAIPSRGYGGNIDLTKTLNYISIKVREVLSRTCSLVLAPKKLSQFFAKLLDFQNKPAPANRAPFKHPLGEYERHGAKEVDRARRFVNRRGKVNEFLRAKIGLEDDAGAVVHGADEIMDGVTPVHRVTHSSLLSRMGWYVQVEMLQF